MIAAAALALAGALSSNPFDVDPFIGTGGGGPERPISAGPGNTFPGAVVPWGMVSPSPHNDRRAPAGYRFGAPRIDGFGMVHLSGVGCPELGDIVLRATTGAVDGETASAYRNERAHPGAYAVELIRFGVHAELTATTHAGLARFTFAARGAATLIFDVGEALTTVLRGSVRVVSPTEIEGWSESGGFCGMNNRHTVHFVARFSAAARATGTRGHRAFARFGDGAGSTITVAIGVSYVSVANARLNLAREVGDVDFDEVRRAAEDAWTRELGKVRVEGGSAAERRSFYTAQYHMLLHPNVISDVNGEYVEMRGKRARRAAGYIRYSVFSLWDTYRLEHPFLTLVHPDRQRDMVRTMVEMYRESGWLPKWELASDETHVMVGDPAAIVIVDTWLRGLRDFDVATAWKAIWKQASTTGKNDIRPGNADYVKYGYIPFDHSGDWVFGTVSTTLEYALADWAAARLARALGLEPPADALAKRAQAYRRYFDRRVQLLRPRRRDGSWLEPFDPKALCCDKPWPESGGPGFVEGNAWQYTFFVPHDVSGLVRLVGGDAAFVKELQQLFDEGQFALGNEPDLALPYLFTYVAGEAGRTRALVRRLARAHFSAAPDGLPGNDDAGALSAWLVWTALGLYPACPASNEYRVGSPLFARATIALDRRFWPGERFVIEADDAAPERVAIQQEEVTRGGTLRLPTTACVRGASCEPGQSRF
jgi:predicted alpha-1,2-mannosidase